MTKRQFVVLSFRLFALYLVFNVITNLGYFLSMLQFEHGFAGAALTSAFGIVILLFALSLLWRKSEWLMQKVFAIPVLSDEILLTKTSLDGLKEEPSETIPDVVEGQHYYETPLSQESVELLALSVVGLWAAFSYLPRLLNELIRYLSFSATLSRLPELYSIPSILGDAVPVILGIWLFLRPCQFQGWIEKFKPKVSTTDKIAN